MRRPSVIYDFATGPSEFPYTVYEENFILFFMSVFMRVPFCFAVGRTLCHWVSNPILQWKPCPTGTSHPHSTRLFSIFNVTKFTHIYTTSPQNTQQEEKIIWCRLCPLQQKIITRYWWRSPSLSSIRQFVKTNYSIKYPLLSSHKIKFISFGVMCVYCSPVFTAFKIIYWPIIYKKITQHYIYVHILQKSIR
jgi:hypothetical protein